MMPVSIPISFIWSLAVGARVVIVAMSVSQRGLIVAGADDRPNDRRDRIH